MQVSPVMYNTHVGSVGSTELRQIAINRRDFGFCERSLLGSSLARASFPLRCCRALHRTRRALSRKIRCMLKTQRYMTSLLMCQLYAGNLKWQRTWWQRTFASFPLSPLSAMRLPLKVLHQIRNVKSSEMRLVRDRFCTSFYGEPYK